MVASTDTLVALRERAGLDLRRERAGCHRALAIREVEDAPCEHLDLAVTVPSLRVLV